MAPTQCCPKCPLVRELSTSGLYRHRGACREYKKYTAARQTLCHRLELEATDAAPVVKRPRTSRSPQGPQHEREAMQFPMTGPARGDVMAPPQTEPSTSCPLSPTPLSPPSPPPPSPSPTPLNPPLSPFLPGPASPLLALSQSGRPQRTHRLPARYQDIYPEPPLPATSLSSPVALLLPPAASMPVPSETAAVQRVTLIVRN